MNNELEQLLAELEQFGSGNDSATTERSRKMLNITRDTCEFLSVLVRAIVARRILEIGTSNGYSTLWLASAAHAIGGAVTTIEFSDYKIALATKNFDNMSEKAREFCVVHKGADVEHTERAATAIAESAISDEDQEKVRTMCRNMAGLKLGKFDSIYDEYA